jgi:ubiquitin-protein ligase
LDNVSVASSHLDELLDDLDQDLAAHGITSDDPMEASTTASEDGRGSSILSRPPTGSTAEELGPVVAMRELEGSGLEVQTTAVMSQVFLTFNVKEGPYEGARLQFWLKVYSDYPQQGPRIRLTTPIFHPNVSTDGSFGEFATVREAVEAIHKLATPDARRPLNPDAAQLYGTDAFARVVQQTLAGGVYGGQKYDNVLARPQLAWQKPVGGKTKKLLKEVETAAQDARNFVDAALRWNRDELKDAYDEELSRAIAS